MVEAGKMTEEKKELLFCYKFLAERNGAIAHCYNCKFHPKREKGICRERWKKPTGIHGNPDGPHPLCAMWEINPDISAIDEAEYKAWVMQMMPTYCPFCGKKYKEKEE
jgi:hypothetical protein